MLVALDCFVGVIGRSSAASGSARRINCSGVSGEPFVEGDDTIDLGLCPVGVRSENVGTKECLGSGVLGGAGGEPTVPAIVVTSAALSNVAELIQFSSWPPTRGGDSESSLKLSAKWSLINLNSKCEPSYVEEYTYKRLTWTTPATRRQLEP